MSHLNPEQTLAVESWKSGHNVRVTAVPGAGKSRVLIEACKHHEDGLILILAYNHDLCEDTKEKILQAGLEDQVCCLTFHGLATYCIMPAYDDMALFDAIEGVESGDMEVQHKIKVSGVMIDEAQDFRPSFLRLMHLVLDVSHSVQWMVVGDEHQMLYTYDEEDSADLKYLSNPNTFFSSTRLWDEIRFHMTHRMTPPMARIVSAVFEADVQSAQHGDSFAPVELYTLNLWRSGPLIFRLIQGRDLREIAILVPKKKNNGPLRAVVNYISARGIKVYLHGTDGQDERVKKNKLCFGTWHSSKGTERRITIVFGLTNAAEKNPCYVACTRAFERLILIQDLQDPYVPLMNSLHRIHEQNATDIKICSETKNLLLTGFKSMTRSSFSIQSVSVYSVDQWRAKGTGRWMREYMLIEQVSVHEATDDEMDIVSLPQGCEQVSDIYMLACLMQVEFSKTRSVRLLDNIVNPIRLPRAKQDEAISEGASDRFIAPNIPAHALIQDDMAGILDIYSKAKQDTQGRISPYHWCELASLALSWNDFHHIMRQCSPFTWLDQKRFNDSVRIVEERIQGRAVDFDVRVSRMSPLFKDTLFHARVHMLFEDRVYMLTWGAPSFADQCRAAIRASLSSKCTAEIVDVKHGNVQLLRVTDPTRLLSRLYEE